MRIGVTLPTFSGDAEGVLAAAEQAENAGVHGVFVFDHLWPMGHPERPSLSSYPMLGAVAASTSRITVGTLVARVALVPDQVLVASLLGVLAIAGPGRLIAGLGTGDRKSEDEHRRYGLPYLGPTARQESLIRVATLLASTGIECWVGAGSGATNDASRATGATLNFWGAPAEVIARERERGPTTWAGPLPAGTDDAAATLSRLEEAGSGWAVWGWPSSMEAVVAAAEAAGIEL